MHRNIPPVGVHCSAGDRKEILSRVDRCLRTGYISQGANVEEFEAHFASYMNCRHAITLSSGGAALEAAMRAREITGKEILLPTNTFYATAAAVLAAGGTVKLLDIDAVTLAPSPEAIVAGVGPDTAGVIIVHLGGIISPSLPAIREVCRARDIWLFEDCAHAHGSSLGGVKAGAFGLGGAYSFFATKVMTTGEGGMLITNDDQLDRQVRLLRNYGKPDPFISSSVAFGLNWRMNELAAIVGVAQLKRLDEFIAWRAQIADIYDRELRADARFTLMPPVERSSWYKYIVLLPAGCDRQQVKSYMLARGIHLPGGVYDLPLHRQPVFAGRYDLTAFPVADDFCARHIYLPIYYGLAPEDARFVARTLRSAADYLPAANDDRSIPQFPGAPRRR